MSPPSFTLYASNWSNCSTKRYSNKTSLFDIQHWEFGRESTKICVITNVFEQHHNSFMTVQTSRLFSVSIQLFYYQFKTCLRHPPLKIKKDHFQTPSTEIFDNFIKLTDKLFRAGLICQFYQKLKKNGCRVGVVHCCKTLKLKNKYYMLPNGYWLLYYFILCRQIIN